MASPLRPCCTQSIDEADVPETIVPLVHSCEQVGPDQMTAFIQQELSVQLSAIDQKLTLLAKQMREVREAQRKDAEEVQKSWRSPYAKTKARGLLKARAVGALVAAGRRKSRQREQLQRDAGQLGADVETAHSSEGSGEARIANKTSTNTNDVTGGIEKESVALGRRRPSTSSSNSSPGLVELIERRLSTSLDDIAIKDPEVRARMTRLRDQALLKKQGVGFRARLWKLTESPYSSKVAYVYAATVHLLIMISVCFSLLQTTEPLQNIVGDITQTTFEALFALELIIRFLCCPDGRAFVMDFCNLVDFMAAIPVTLRVGVLVFSGPLSNGQRNVLSMVALLRLLRLWRHFETLQLLTSAFRISAEALPAMLYCWALIAITFSELMFLVEPRENMSDMPSALWFTIVTMTTVGFGDKTPASVVGHVVASVLIITSTLYMAIPIGIVGNAFSQVWGDRDRLLVMRRFRDAFLLEGYTAIAVQDLFLAFDADGSGELDIEEFGLLLQTMQVKMSANRVCMLFQALDKEGQGRISLEALVDGIVPKRFVHSLFRSSRMRSQSM